MDCSKSRKSDAAATRKRRSSILKSQRPPRTPFSELEFNVATPTDAKSRRVSFSRQHGVAEFEITEATTAWKNVYVEHHKSLESSVNESDSKGEKPLVGYLASRVPGLNFEDAEAELVNASGFRDQLAASFVVGGESTRDDKTLSAPHKNFELSEFTDLKTNKLFADDANPAVKEATDHIDLNFSVDPVAKFNESYLDVDFNATHISLKAEESVSDMSITDTIHSPKVAASEAKSEEKVDNWVMDKENIVVNPYVAPLPSENFAVAEDCNDVLVFDGKKCKFQSDLKNEDLPDPGDMPDPVTANKRRTIVYNDDAGDISITQAVPDRIMSTQDLNATSRKLSNTVYGNESNISMTRAVPNNVIISNQQEKKQDKQETIYFNDIADMSVTAAVPSIVTEVKNEQHIKTIVYQNDEGHVSMTEAVPANIIIPEVSERRKTIVYQNDEGHVSMTEAVPANIIIPEVSERRKTIVYQNYEGHVSMTEAVPANIIIPEVSERRKTIVYQNDEGHVSMTEAVPANIIIPEVSERRKTIVYQNDEGDISLTQAVPINILQTNNQVSEKRKTILYESDAAELEMTRAVPENVLLADNSVKTKTILFPNDDGNMSVTQTVPARVMSLNDTHPDKRSNHVTCEKNTDANDVALTIGSRDLSLQELEGRVKYIQESIVADVTRLCSEALSISQNATDATSKRRTIVFNDDQASVSITQARPVNILEPVPPVFDSKKSIIYEGTAADISITQAVPFDLVNKSSIVNDITLRCEVMPDCNVTVPTAVADISVNKTVLHEQELTPGVHSSSHNIKGDDTFAVTIHEGHHDHANKSITRAASNVSTKNITICKDDLCNVSVTNPIPTQMLFIENDLADKTKLEKTVQIETYSASFDLTVPGPQNVIVYEAAIKLDKTNDVIERHPTESVSNQTFSSKSGEANPKSMKEAEHASDSTESIVNVRDDPSMKPVKENDNPVIDQTSVLNDLLDMSNASMNGKNADKKATVNTGSHPSSGDISVAKNCSEESYLIIKDSDSEPVDSETDRSAPTNKSLPAEFDKSHTIAGKIQQKLEQLKSSISIKNPKPKRIKCLQNITKQDKPLETEPDSPPTPKANKTTSNPDDTNALLDMISHFTDTRRASRDVTREDDGQPAPVDYNGHIAIEDKTGGRAARPSALADRRSRMRSREDLRRDMSMTAATLRHEAAESDDSEAAPGPAPRREVVKTLTFDDDDDSLLHEPDSPLKKTAFGETAYMRDSKTKVIPDYLSYAADLKDLMDDLVKPMADMVPSSGAPARSASACSTQIQANLLTSSQIDLDFELDPEPDACSADVPPALTSAIADMSNMAISRALENEMLRDENPADASARPLANHTADRLRRSAGRVIFFDHHNPLNNVLLPAIDAGEVHGYDPRVSAASLVASELAEALPGDGEEEEAARRGVESRVALHRLQLPSGDAAGRARCAALAAGPRTADRGVLAATLDLKDSEVNTLIAMKKNNELLDTSSSLTLVDDTMHSPFEIADSDSPSPPKVPSPIKVIFKVKDASSLKLDTELTSAEDDVFPTQAKKRVYSPANREKKHCTFAHDVTPKPASKVQRTSGSPTGPKSPPAHPLLTSNRAMEVDLSMDATSEDTSGPDALDQPHRRRSRASKVKTADVLTIHHLAAEYDMEARGRGSGSGHSLSTEPATEGSERAAGSAGAPRSLPGGGSEGGSSASRAGWRPELLHEMSSKNLVAECDSSANVVAKIDVLPFMGSPECEWETRGADAWSLRLLRGRVRLALRLQHRHDNAPRTRVRADTCVLAALVQPVADHGEDDPIAALCVRFACEAMRARAARVGRAGEAPALLRRCAGVARVAQRWARALHAARAHLAFSLAHSGDLSLKVANIPLRSVWEVTMRLELAKSEDEDDAPWPMAAAVRVARVVSELPVDAAEVARVLAPVPRDWGHVPRTIWKIFKHLKHRTREVDILI